MAGPAPISGNAAETRVVGAPASGQAYGKTLALLASLFFMWGFITVINNTLLPHLRSVFDLNYTQTTLIESVWFIAYFVASMPSAFLIERVGYRRAIIIGLLIMAVGSLAMVPAARLPSPVHRVLRPGPRRKDARRFMPSSPSSPAQSPGAASILE